MERFLRGQRAQAVPLYAVLGCIVLTLLQSEGMGRLWVLLMIGYMLGLHFGLAATAILYRYTHRIPLGVAGVWVAGFGVGLLVCSAVMGLTIEFAQRQPWWIADLGMAGMMLLTIFLVMQTMYPQLWRLASLHRKL